MFADAAAEGFHHAGQGVGHRHILASFQIPAILDGGGKALSDEPDRLEAVLVAERICNRVQISLGAVEKSIEALVCGKVRRNRDHQGGIDNTQDRKGIVIAIPDFFLSLFLGNDQPRIGFGAGAGGGGDGNHSKGLVLHRLPFAAAAADIVPQVALVGRHNCDGLGRVDDRASTQTDDKVTSLLSCKLGTLCNMGEDGVGKNLVKHLIRHLCGIQLVLDLLQVSE